MSAYSRLHESHIGNSAIAVLSLSYGNDDNNVNLAPQLVHVVNAYPLRLPSDLISLRHSSQTAVSVGMLMITIACSIKMLSVPEEREKFDVRWLWKH